MAGAGQGLGIANPEEPTASSFPPEGLVWGGGVALRRKAPVSSVGVREPWHRGGASELREWEPGMGKAPVSFVVRGSWYRGGAGKFQVLGVALGDC